MNSQGAMTKIPNSDKPNPKVRPTQGGTHAKAAPSLPQNQSFTKSAIR